MATKRSNQAGRFCFRYDDYQGNAYLIPAAAAMTFDKMQTDIEELPSEERKQPLEALFEMFGQYEVRDTSKYTFSGPREDL